AGADIGARLIQDRLQARWGKPVVIENRPGGDSMIAIQDVLSANDDHTFLWGPSGSFIVHPYQYKKLPYDPADLLPVARFSSTVLGVAVPASRKIATLADFVSRARAEPPTANTASPANVNRSPPDARRTTLCRGVRPPVRRTTTPGATSYSASTGRSWLRYSFKTPRLHAAGVHGRTSVGRRPELGLGSRQVNPQVRTQPVLHPVDEQPA